MKPRPGLATSGSPAAQPGKDLLRLAAIDVGSNSVHMIIAQADADGSITTLWRLKEMVGLGRMSFPSRNLGKEAMDRAIAALARFRQVAQQRQVEKIIAVATSAVREAGNGGDFIERCKRELGLNVKVVSAREEARLIYLAVRHALPLTRRPQLMFDIGGGSVEFIFGDRDRAHLMESRKLGAARMTARFITTDPISKKNLSDLQAHYDAELTPLVRQLAPHRLSSAIGTSGTLECLAALCGAPSRAKSARRGDGADKTPSPGVIERRRFAKLLKKLVASDNAGRAQLRGLDDQRRDQIVAGAVLVGELFERLKLKEIRLCPAALREGILLDYLNRHLPELTIRRDIPDPRRRSVIDLARRCDWHRVHAEHVAHLTLRLFDELKSLHGLNGNARELIDYGALLHDIGFHIARKGHHKHSLYLILNGDLRNFDKHESLVIGNIARYHRKSLPRAGHAAFARLPARRRRVVEVGGSLLRIADGLDRSHHGVVRDLQCRLKDGRVLCRLTTRGDPQLELWGAKRKMKWFKKVFGRPIDFEIR